MFIHTLMVNRLLGSVRETSFTVDMSRVIYFDRCAVFFRLLLMSFALLVISALQALHSPPPKIGGLRV